MSGSGLRQTGAHEIDILHRLCGAYTKTVTATGGLTLYDQITDRHDAAERGDASFVRDNTFLLDSVLVR